jgi:hypothetical protein
MIAWWQTAPMSFLRKQESTCAAAFPRLREGKLWTPAFAGVTRERPTTAILLGPLKVLLMHVVMMGCRGIPATYGGVEKAVEELSVRLARQGHQVTVLCRSHYTPKMTMHENVNIVRLPTIRQKTRPS